MLANYEILNSIGCGGYAQVFLAADHRCNRDVALKLLCTKKFSDLDWKHLKNEISSLQLLQHKNIIGLHSVLEESDRTALVMEYALCGDLREYINRSGHLLEYEARVIMRQLSEALQFAHSKNILHRDVKLDNILLDESQCVKLADWGLSCECLPGTRLTEFVGSLHYSAPEVLRGQPYGIEIDSWGAGVVLYALVTGMLPFAEDADIDDTKEAERDLRRRIRRAQYLIPNGISSSCQILIRSLLEVDPTKRLTMDQVLSHPWTRGSVINVTCQQLLYSSCSHSS